MNADKNGSFHHPSRIFRTYGAGFVPSRQGRGEWLSGREFAPELQKIEIGDVHDLKESLPPMTIIQKDKSPPLLIEKRGFDAQYMAPS